MRKPENKRQYLLRVFGRMRKFIIIITLAAIFFLFLIVAQKRSNADFRGLPTLNSAKEDQNGNAVKAVDTYYKSVDLHKATANHSSNEQLHDQLLTNVERYLSQIQKGKGGNSVNINDLKTFDKDVKLREESIKLKVTQRNAINSHEKNYEKEYRTQTETATTTTTATKSFSTSLETSSTTSSTTLFTTSTTGSDDPTKETAPESETIHLNIPKDSSYAIPRQHVTQISGLNLQRASSENQTVVSDTQHVANVTKETAPESETIHLNIPRQHVTQISGLNLQRASSENQTVVSDTQHVANVTKETAPESETIHLNIPKDSSYAIPRQHVTQISGLNLQRASSENQTVVSDTQHVANDLSIHKTKIDKQQMDSNNAQQASNGSSIQKTSFDKQQMDSYTQPAPNGLSIQRTSFDKQQMDSNTQPNASKTVLTVSNMLQESFSEQEAVSDAQQVNKQQASSDNLPIGLGFKQASSEIRPTGVGFQQAISDKNQTSFNTLQARSIKHMTNDIQQAGSDALPEPGRSVKSTGNEASAKTFSHTAESDTSKEKELRKRTWNAQDYCQANGYPLLKSDDTITLLHNMKYNLDARAIPKIGSTFLIQMFSILNNGVDSAKEVFQRSRMKIHYKPKFKAKFSLPDLENSMVFTAVRNPYSRLFAAYVDKIYLPNYVKLSRAVIDYSKRDEFSQTTKPFLSIFLGESQYRNIAFDQHTVSFQDFLSYALHSKNPVLGGHYNPCFPKLEKLICNADNYVIVKQESFADDIRYVLRKIQLHIKDPESYDVIVQSLEASRAEVTVPGIIKTVLDKYPRGNKIWNRNVLVERLWHSFQIQGYIDKKSPFPGKKFISELDKKYIINIILKEIQNHSLTPKKRTEQRKEAMLEAYRHVDKKLIKKIQEVYADDFSAFQYDNDL